MKRALRVKELPKVEPAPALLPNREQTLAACELDKIPALQALVQNFERTMDQRRVTVDEIVASLSKDPALCVRVLRLANSTEVSSEQRVESLDTAVQLLGIERVRNVAEAMLILRSAAPKPGELDMRQLWIHALATAMIAQELEQRVRGQNNAPVYLAGLLHDVGKIVLSMVAPVEYRTVLVEALKEGQSIADLERAHLGVDHAEAGLAFARRNQLPAIIIQAIAHHANPSNAESHLLEVALVAIANSMAKQAAVGFSGSELAGTSEFATLPGWGIVATALGGPVDLAALEPPMRKFMGALRPQLNSLLESAEP